MEKVWLKKYEPGVPAEIDPNAYDSVVDLFNQSCDKYRRLPAVSNFGSTMTYDQLDRYARDFAAYLQAEFNVTKGERVAIMMPNCIQYLVAMFGAMRAGCVIVNVNPLYTPRELIHQLNDSGASTLIVLNNFAHTVEEALPNVNLRHVIVTELGDMFSFPKKQIVNFVVKKVKKMVKPWSIPSSIPFSQVLRRGKSYPFKEVEIRSDDVAFLQYTGGTTGVAKGAVLLHRNMIANVEQGSAWIREKLEEAKEVIVTALPLYHIFSLTANCMVFIKYGAKNILITNPRDIPNFAKALEKEKFTGITGVNTLFNALMHNKAFCALDFSHLKVSLGGGMAVQRDVATRWKKLTGCTLVQAYGLTETSPAVTMNRLNLKEFNGSIGLPLPSTEVSIRDEDGKEVKLGEKGELWVRGPQVMREYWNMAEETHKVLSDGWLKTGDIAKMDEEGLIYLVDRLKDMILVSGFNVYPTEVEETIADLPGVLEVGVVGLPHRESGEVVTAHIVKEDPDLKKEQVMAHCRKQLTAYKVPKRIYFYDELPKTNVGKILRRELRENLEKNA